MVHAGTAPVVEIDQLRRQMRGMVLTPGAPGYDESCVIWNEMIQRKPAVIAQCVSAADVVSALKFGREHGLEITVRGGGHNVSGNCIIDGGLMIDLSGMKSIRIDPEARTARVEPGVVWGELDQEAQAFGLATVGGTVAHTGVAGLTLGGGFGWLTDKHGLTVDNLLSADVVTADGRLLYASEDEHPDLFWALRGAGANFGIVTSFEYRLHPVGPRIVGGMVLYPVEQLSEVLQFYRDFLPGTPDELTAYAAVLTTPDGVQAVAIAVCYSGDLEEGLRVVAPLREICTPLVDLIRPITYLEQQAILTEASPFGWQNYWKAGLSRSLSDDAIEVISGYATSVPSPFTKIVLAGNNGAAGRVSPSDTAYYHRKSPFNMMILSAWADPADNEVNIQWTRDFHRDLSQHLSGGVYVNDLCDPADEGDARVREAYGENYPILAGLKLKYDPDNVFRHNQNIRPADQQISERPAFDFEPN